MAGKADPRTTENTEEEAPAISVLIVNWNRQDFIKATLEDLRKHWYPGMEVLVVDNGSTDGTPDMIAEQFPEVRLLRLEENVGQCKGLNIGLESVRSDIVVSLDNDATLREGSFERIISKFRRHPRLAVARWPTRPLRYDDHTGPRRHWNDHPSHRNQARHHRATPALRGLARDQPRARAGA